MKKRSKSLIWLCDRHFGADNKCVGVEVGFWRGENAVEVSHHAPHIQMCGVDNWSEGLGEANRLESIRVAGEHGIKLYEGDSAEISRKHFCQNSVDFVFIDGAHDRLSVVTDLIAWWPVVRHGGFLSGHDYGGRGDRVGKFQVKESVDQFAQLVDRKVLPCRGRVWSLTK